MKNTRILPLGLVFLVLTASFISAVIADAEFVTVNPGEEGKITLNVENNENFDIENVHVSLILTDLPFSSVGSSSKDVDDLDEDDDDSTTFTLRASTDAVPGDYDIPYTIKYVDAQDNTKSFTDNGSFGIRISAQTDLDFSAETRETSIIGQEGQISLEIINRGLGEVKSVSVELVPQGFELLSANKIFVGTIDSDDSDIATFDVVYRAKNPIVTAKISYKDFDNKDQAQVVNLPIKTYTRDEALQLGLIEKSNTLLYVGLIVLLIILWIAWRTVRKRRKKKQQEKLK
jgi:hypothetical protein